MPFILLYLQSYPNHPLYLNSNYNPNHHINHNLHDYNHHYLNLNLDWFNHDLHVHIV